MYGRTYPETRTYARTSTRAGVRVFRRCEEPRVDHPHTFEFQDNSPGADRAWRRCLDRLSAFSPWHPDELANRDHQMGPAASFRRHSIKRAVFAMDPHPLLYRAGYKLDADRG